MRDDRWQNIALLFKFAYQQFIGHFMISFVAMTNAWTNVVLLGILHNNNYVTCQLSRFFQNQQFSTEESLKMEQSSTKILFIWGL